MVEEVGIGRGEDDLGAVVSSVLRGGKATKPTCLGNGGCIVVERRLSSRHCGPMERGRALALAAYQGGTRDGDYTVAEAGSAVRRVLVGDGG